MPNTKKRRNPRCPCGSRQKYKKCCGIKQPRGKIIRQEFGKSVDMSKGEINLHTNSKSGMPSVHLDGKKVDTVKTAISDYYDKKKVSKGRKITSYFVTDDTDSIENTIEPIFNYEYLIVTDASYKRDDKKGTCGVGVLLLKRSDDKLSFILFEALRLEFDNAAHEPEMCGWIFGIERYHPQIGSEVSCGLLTDYDLGNLEKINSRKEPIVDGLALPSNINLTYAFDKSNHQIANKLMKLADKISKLSTDYLNSLCDTQFDCSVETDYFSNGKLGVFGLSSIQALTGSI